MSKPALFISLLAALALLGSSWFFLTNRSQGRGTAAGAGLRELESRTSKVLTDLDRRLGALEERGLASGSERRDRASNADPGADGEEGGDPAVPVRGRLEEIEAELDALRAEVRGLAQEPIARAFAYVDSASPELRRRGIDMLRRVARSDPEALAAIRRLLEDPDGNVREEALEALADVGDRDSIPRILDLLADSESGVRREAMGALADLLEDVDPADPNLQAATRSLAGHLADPDPRVRREAADVLGDFRGLAAVPELIRALDDADGNVREEAIDSLADLGDPAAIPRLRALYGDGTGEHAFDIAVALRRLGEPGPFQNEAARLSQVATSSANAQDRENAIEALGDHGGVEFRDLFTQALNDPDPDVQREARRALRRLDDE